MTQLTSIATQLIDSHYTITDGVSKPILFLKYRYYRALLAPKGKRISAIWSDFFKIDVVFSWVRLPERLSFLYYGLYMGWGIYYLGRNLYALGRRCVTKI